jgi:hypothetical protein
MVFPSFADTADGRGCTSEDKVPAANRPAANMENFDEVFARTSGSETSSEVQLESLASAASTILPEWIAVDQEVLVQQDLLTFDLDPTTLPADVLCHLAMAMFVSAGLPAGVGVESVRRLILSVRASMLDNPYHNFYHAFDVMQTTNALSTATGIMARLGSWERFALLSAALW